MTVYYTDATDCVWDNSGYFNATGTTISLGNNQDAGDSPSHGYFRFASVTIPQAAIITSAILALNVLTSRNGNTCKVKAYCNDADTSTAPTSRAQAEALALTTAYTSKTFADATGATTIDITSAVQEVIDRVGWASGNNLGVVVRDDVSSLGRDRLMEAFEHAGTSHAYLTIEYVSDVTVTPAAASAVSASVAPTFKHYFTPGIATAVAASVAPTWKYAVTPTAASAIAASTYGMFREPILLHAPYRYFGLTAPEVSMTLHAPYRTFTLTAPEEP